MKRGASKRMMLLIAGGGAAILLLVTLGYMLANHREGNSSKKCPPCPACPATAATKAKAEKLDPIPVLLIQDLQRSSKRLLKETYSLSKIKPNEADKRRYIIHFGENGNCPNLSEMKNMGKFNYLYNGMTTCNVIRPNEYNGQGTATNPTTGETITITKQMLIDALAQVDYGDD